MMLEELLKRYSSIIDWIIEQTPNDKAQEYINLIIMTLSRPYILNDEYMGWLEQTSHLGKITYNEEIISINNSKDIVLNQLSLLKVLFQIIKLYANLHKIKCENEGLVFSYYLKYNNEIYKLSQILDLKSTYILERQEVKELPNVILFNELKLERTVKK